MEQRPYLTASYRRHDHRIRYTFSISLRYLPHLIWCNALRPTYLAHRASNVPKWVPNKTSKPEVSSPCALLCFMVFMYCNTLPILQDYSLALWQSYDCHCGDVIKNDFVSNHQPHHCLLNRLFRRRSKKTSKLRVTGLCVGNSPGTSELPAQMANNAENISIWWRHHVLVLMKQAYMMHVHVFAHGSMENISYPTRHDVIHEFSLICS